MDVAVLVGSRQPNHPGFLQDVVVEVSGAVIVGAGVAVTVAEVVVGSLHPNHPGVLHVEVVVERPLEEVVVAVVVVLLSKQPHQPGVLQIDVLVGMDDVAEVVIVLVVISEPLLLKNFHSSQS